MSLVDLTTGTFTRPSDTTIPLPSNPPPGTAYTAPPPPGRWVWVPDPTPVYPYWPIVIH